MVCVLDKLLGLARGIAMLVLPLTVDGFNRRVCKLARLVLKSSGIVCDGLRLVKMGFLWVYRDG